MLSKISHFGKIASFISQNITYHQNTFSSSVSQTKTVCSSMLYRSLRVLTTKQSKVSGERQSWRKTEKFYDILSCQHGLLGYTAQSVLYADFYTLLCTVPCTRMKLSDKTSDYWKIFGFYSYQIDTIIYNQAFLKHMEAYWCLLKLIEAF